MKEKELQKHVENSVELIRNRSEDGKLTKSEHLSEELSSLSEEDIQKILEKIKESEEFTDIKFLKTSSTLYLYSSRWMTGNYAKLLIRISEKDLLGLIAETVREESRVYPRTTDIRSLCDHPFLIKAEEIERLLQEIKARSEYQDIQEVRASNGALYLYSNQYLSNDHAIGLTEWVEVIQREIP